MSASILILGVLSLLHESQLRQEKQSQHSKLTLSNFSPDAFIPHDRALLHARFCS
ncbi:hypothetical protein [Microcoleus sp. Pol12A6]|uniref:hypothetical protein n=1 Tax=Microcoleus sp. Pol12A6 TaxID=3055393 RepID=UPI0002FF7D68